MPPLRPPASRTAIVQDWFFAPGGSERCAIEFARLLPDADIFTTFFDPAYAEEFLGRRVHTWPIQRLVGPTRRYRSFLPLYPFWFQSIDLRDRDLIISSSSAFAKAVRTRPGALHVSYIHSPMRYAWELDRYLGQSSFPMLARAGARMLKPFLRRWDRRTARRPDVLVANSETTRDRIAHFWQRDSTVIYPPVDVQGIPTSSEDEGFLLVAARMVSYRRLDLAVVAATRMNRNLIVVGSGPEEHRLKELAGPSVTFLGSVGRSTLIDLFRRCHAYLAPGVEDFGIAPVEAMAAGKPVIGRNAGGVAESVIDGRTGVLFDEPTVEALCAAIERAEGIVFERKAIRARATCFDTAVFWREWVALLDRAGVDPSLYSRR
jgi:glycosyltransferase involved in cell wall biosynthesis